MSFREWINLNKRVMKLEKTLQKIEQDNIALISAPFIEASLEGFEDGIIRGREIEEEATLLDEETVEEREYREEQNWLARRKQKAKMV